MRELRSAVRTGALILSMTAQSEAAGWAADLVCRYTLELALPK